MNEDPRIDPELEARIVALVLGEASDFEREELTRIVDERPELAAFMEQIQQTHRVLRNIGTTEFQTEGEWKLSPERRESVLATLDGRAPTSVVEVTPKISFVSRRRLISRLSWVAATFLVVGLTGSVVFFGLRSQHMAKVTMGDVRIIRQSNILGWGHATDSAITENFQAMSSVAAATEQRDKAAAAYRDMTGGEQTALGMDRYYASDLSLSSKSFAKEPQGQQPDVVLQLDSFGPSKVELRTWSRAAGEESSTSTPSLANSPEPSKPQSNYTLAVPEVPAGAESVRLFSATGVDQNGDGDLAGEPTSQQSFGINAESKDLGTFTFEGRRSNWDKASNKTARELGGASVQLADQVGQPTTASQAGQSLMFRGAPQIVDAEVAEGESLEEQGVAQDSQFGRTEAWAGGVPAADAGGGVDAMGPMGGGDMPGAAGGIVSNGTVPSPGGTRGQYGYGGGGGYGGYGGAGGGYGGYGGDGASPATTEGSDGISPGGRGGPILGNLQSIRSDDDRAEYDVDTDGLVQDEISRPEAFGEELAEDLFVDPDTADAASSEPAGSATLELYDNFADFKGTKESAPQLSAEDEAQPQFASPDGRDLAITSGSQDRSLRVWSAQPPPEKPVSPPTARYAESQTADDLFDFDQSNLDGWRYDAGIVRGESRTRWGTNGRISGAVPSNHPASNSESLERAKKALEDVAKVTDFQNAATLGKSPIVNYRQQSKNLFGEPLSGVTSGKLPAQQQQQGQVLGLQGVERTLRMGQAFVPASGTTSHQKRAPQGLDEKVAQNEAFSTFSLHVSDVSFKLARAALAAGEWPEAAKVRIEEFVNAFDYGDPLPTEQEKVACQLEQAIHPFLQQRNVLRVSMRTAATGRSSNTPLRLTFLLDNSGSMERPDRQQTVRRAFALLAEQLKPIDQVTLISFARQPRLLADRVSGEKSRELVRMIEGLPSEGGTNIEAALRLALDKALEQQQDGVQNRVILLTDGAVNLGNAEPESLAKSVSAMRKRGIAFDAAGIIADGLNDEVLEALTRKGDGRYYLLDSVDSADDGFVRQIAGALRPSAKNVKVQVEFNPERVGRYKLLGFEKHRLKKEDFRNDQVDAAEMTAAEAGVAVYQFEAKPGGNGDVGSVSVRFQDLSSGQMIERRWPIPYEPHAVRINQASSSIRLATTAAMFAAKLRGEPLGTTVDLSTLSSLVSELPEAKSFVPRVVELTQMIQQAREIGGN